MVPLREAIEVFASPEKLTDPFVVPEVVDPKCSHEVAFELTDAVHEQELPDTVTVMVLVPPRAAML
jgi:hypothetical protein